MKLVLLPLALLPLFAAPAPGATTSVAVFVEPGTPSGALASLLEEGVRKDGVRIVSAAEVGAAAKFLSLSPPFEDAVAERLRSELQVDRLVIVSSKPGPGSEIFAMVRFVDRSGVTRRYVSTTATSFDADVGRLVSETAPPLAPLAPPASSTRVAAPAGPERRSFDVPARSIVFADAPLDAGLVGADVLVHGANGSYYRGLVSSVNADSLVLDDQGKPRTFGRSDVRTLTVLRPHEPPVFPGERITVVTKTARLEGEVTATSPERFVLAAKEGSREIAWHDVARIEVPPARREVGAPDVETLGIRPVALLQPAAVPPAEARRANVTGVVVLRIVVDITGFVAQAEVVRSSPMFDAAAIEAVRRWRYVPLVLEGKPTAWSSTVNVHFNAP